MISPEAIISSSYAMHEYICMLKDLRTYLPEGKKKKIRKKNSKRLEDCGFLGCNAV
jgi:hypothetical protein